MLIYLGIKYISIHTDDGVWEMAIRRVYMGKGDGDGAPPYQEALVHTYAL